MKTNWPLLTLMIVAMIMGGMVAMIAAETVAASYAGGKTHESVASTPADDSRYHRFKRYARDYCDYVQINDDGEAMCYAGEMAAWSRIYASCILQSHYLPVESCLDRHLPRGRGQ